MSDWLSIHEGEVKLSLALVLLALLALLQALHPLRGDGLQARRWHANLGLILVSTLALRLLLPAGAVAFAGAVKLAGIGLLNVIPADGRIEFLGGILAMDLAMYWQHRAFHAIPLLWRAHRVHHSDTGFDTSLGLRFHPLEILPSQAYKLALILALGIGPETLLAYECLLLAFSLWTHADLALPAAWDRAVCWVWVTPDWHRVHHSTAPAAGNSHFGNILSVWDRLFGTRHCLLRRRQRGMEIGLREFRDPADQTLSALLLQPFRPAGAGPCPSQEAPRA